jgi:hypothetical protein
MCCIQHCRSDIYAFTMAGVPHMRCRKKCLPHLRPSHSSRPELMNPGTITTGHQGLAGFRVQGLWFRV